MTENTDTPLTVLVVDDDPGMLEMLATVLRDAGYGVVAAGGGDEAIAGLETGTFDIVLTDVRMPGRGGMDVLRAARTRHLHQPVILMTAFGSVDAAVAALREGAYSYITKPFDIDRLLEVVAECADQVRLVTQSLPEEPTNPCTPFPVVSRDPAFKRVIHMVHEVARSNATVLVSGESGTGKELVAREIHWRSRRREAPFVAVDANAIPENLLESELFGYAKGAFTGAGVDHVGIIEQADGGTLFLDEVGNLNLTVQSKLLRFLQERRFRRVGDPQERFVDVRLITATNRDLDRLMREDKFREDLFYRLSVIHIHVPSLRERREDISPLAYHFLRRFNRDFDVTAFRPSVLDALIDYGWPGNVRQLENAVEHAVVMRKRGVVELEDLPEYLVPRSEPDLSPRSLDALEREQILKVLSQCNGNQTRAASILGINRRTLYRKLRDYRQTT